jgi:SPP1 family predicted phage head-tail adaptor
MRSGDLHDRIALQSITSETRGTRGESTPTWTTYATAYADIKPLSARQLEVARAYADTVSHSMRIRYRSGVSPTHRAIIGSRVFTFNGVVETVRRSELTIYATEIVS